MFFFKVLKHSFECETYQNFNNQKLKTLLHVYINFKHEGVGFSYLSFINMLLITCNPTIPL